MCPASGLGCTQPLTMGEEGLHLGLRLVLCQWVLEILVKGCHKVAVVLQLGGIITEGEHPFGCCTLKRHGHASYTGCLRPQFSPHSCM